jgi:hypothetical protein
MIRDEIKLILSSFGKAEYKDKKALHELSTLNEQIEKVLNRCVDQISSDTKKKLLGVLFPLSQDIQIMELNIKYTHKMKLGKVNFK